MIRNLISTSDIDNITIDLEDAMEEHEKASIDFRIEILVAARDGNIRWDGYDEMQIQFLGLLGLPDKPNHPMALYRRVLEARGILDIAEMRHRTKLILMSKENGG